MENHCETIVCLVDKHAADIGKGFISICLMLFGIAVIYLFLRSAKK